MNENIRYMRNRSYKRVHRPGLAALPIIFTLLAFGLLLGVVVSMTSTTRVASVSATLANTADYMAESGLRYAAAYYVQTQNDDLGSDDDYRNNTADDDKTLALVNALNNKTFNVRTGQSFHLDVYAYYLYSETNQTGTTWALKFPGQVPAGATFPANGRMILYDETGQQATSIGYTGRTVNTGTSTITLTGVSSTTLRRIQPYQQAFPALRPNSDQTISNTGVSDLILNNGGGTNFVLPFNGLVKIPAGGSTLDLLYRRAVFSGTTVTLQGLRTLDNTAFSQTVATTQDVSFLRNIKITSEGSAGGYLKKRDFYTPIHSSNKEQNDVSLLLTTSSELNNNFTQSDSVGSKSVQTLSTSSGGSATFSIIESLDANGSNPRHGNLWLYKYSLIDDAWTDGNQKLDYAVQVKLATGKYLAYGGLGLSFRARRVGGVSEPNHYLGVSFLKYNLPRIYFRYGEIDNIQAGDTVVGGASGASGVVVGDPVITQTGSNIRGTLRLAGVTGTFSAGEDLEIGGDDVAEVVAYTAPAADYIPNDIKPFYSDLVNHADLGPLLLVLWERKGSAWRWLAVKDVTNDYFAAGSQDWNPPEGNCIPGSPLPCPEYDGQIVNDEASLLLRVEETVGIPNGGTTPVKYNIISVFNGDNSARYSSGVTRAGNAIPYDRPYLGYAGNRRKYVTNSASFPNWPPTNTGAWSVDADFFSHVEEPSAGNQFQWDHLNPAVTDDTLVMNHDGTILYTGLTTPDCATEPCAYLESEIGLHAFGDVRTNPYATAGFVDFALRLYGEGYQYGGFLNAYMQ